MTPHRPGRPGLPHLTCAGRTTNTFETRRSAAAPGWLRSDGDTGRWRDFALALGGSHPNWKGTH
jgi:hypothetical protein